MFNKIIFKEFLVNISSVNPTTLSKHYPVLVQNY
jgi:hypothetical protein